MDRNEKKAQIKENSPVLSAGIISSDLNNLGSAIKKLEEVGVKLIHFDVMDGCFAPKLTFGPPFIRNLKSSLLKDVHLMIDQPVAKLSTYIKSGADIITVHVEASRHIHRTLQVLNKKEDIIVGVAMNPGTSIVTIEPLLDKIDLIYVLAVNPGWSGQKFEDSTYLRLKKVRELIVKNEKQILVAVDGGITKDNITKIAYYKPDIIVSGSAIFNGEMKENLKEMRRAIK